MKLKNQKKDQKIVLYPFLFAIFPILFLYGNNVSNLSVSVLLVPSIAALASVTFLLIIGILIYKNSQKAGVVVLLAVVIFFSYGYVWDFLRTFTEHTFNSQLVAASIVRHRFLFPLSISIFLIVAISLYRVKNTFSHSAKFLNVMGMVLISLNLLIVLQGAIKGKNGDIRDGADRMHTHDTPAMNSKLRYLPDIYYITVDEFAGFETIQKIYNYDAQPFKKYLLQHNFIVQNSAFSNYNKTEFSLASSMYMDYVNNNIIQADHNNVGSILKNAGYSIIELPVKSVSWQVLWQNEFCALLINNSIFRMFHSEFNRLHIKNLFNQFIKVVHIRGPKFVHFHIPAPHTPFLFKEDGSRLSTDDVVNWQNKSIYLGQWKYVEKRIEECVDSIFKQSSKTPIIIIQSDHGVREVNDVYNKYAVAFNIVNAVYLPERDSGIFYKGLTPVNTFRVIFNNYFGTHFELLPDRNFYPEDKDFKKFKDITDSVGVQRIMIEN